MLPDFALCCSVTSLYTAVHCFLAVTLVIAIVNKEMSDKEMEIGITFSLIIFLNHNYHKEKSSLIF